MVREKCLSSDRCFHLCSEIHVSSAISFRKQDMFNPSVPFVIPQMGLNNSRNRLFIPEMGLMYSPEGVCIPQIRLIKLILRPGVWQNGRAVIVLVPRKLQSIIYNFKACFKTFHSAGVRPRSAYAVANWDTPFKKSITKVKSEKMTHQ